MSDIRTKVLFLSLFWLFSCHHGLVVRTDTPIDDGEARSILKGLAEQNISVIRLLGSAKLDSKEKRVFFKHAVLAKRDMMYITALKFGAPFVHVSIKKGLVKAFAPDSGEYFLGKDADIAFEDLIGINIGLHDLTGILLGGAFVPSEFKIEKASLLNGRYYRIIISQNGDGPRRQYTVDGKNMSLTELRISKGDTSLAIRVSKYKKSKILYPFRINIIRETPYALLDMKIERTDLDPVLKDQAFDIPFPQGITPIPIERLDMF